MKVTTLNVNEIFADDDFNCRGPIAPIDVLDLVKDIQEKGLLQPIIVKSYNNPHKPQYKYILLAGYRRLKAHLVGQISTISAIVRDDLSYVDSVALNLSENIKRENLNILQEARSVLLLKNQKLSDESIKEKLGVSLPWIKIRLQLLALPKEIQEAAVRKEITQQHIKDLYALPEGQRLSACRLMKDKKAKGEKVNIAKLDENGNIIKKVFNPLKKRRRDESEICEIISHLSSIFGFNLTTRALAWSAGNISTLELYHDIKEEAHRNGKHDYTIPEEILKASF